MTTEANSLTPQEVKLAQLRELFPEAFTEEKVDWEKLKATLGEDVNFANERYVLNWAGKSDAFRVLQLPTTKTLVPAKAEGIDFDATQNIFIEGENLEVLKVLQKSYFGKVKMIYIDPPYNTGNDSFIYPDKFSETKAEYEKRVGDKDDDGYMTADGMFRKNSKENGQYHSNWLNMMMPRLYLAKNLLRQDGVIFVSIDDNEVHNLRLLMNEIFGEENFVECFVWRSRLGKGSTSTETATIHEYIICYAKHIDLIDFLSDVRTKENDTKERLRQWGQGDKREDRPSMYFPISHDIYGQIYPLKPDGSHGRWRASQSKVAELQINDLLVFEKQNDGRVEVYKKILAGSTTETAQDSLLNSDEVKTTAHGSKEFSSLFSEKVFDYPKPSTLIKHFLKVINDDEAIILDFFAGSGTTAHAVVDLNKDGGNRKYICVQLPELTDENSEAFKAGYKTIAEISKERIRRASNKIRAEIETGIAAAEAEMKELKDALPLEEIAIDIELLETKIAGLKSQDLGFKVLKLAESNFKQWQQIDGQDIKALEEQIKLFVDPVAEGAEIENIVYELLLKNGKDLNSRIEKKDDVFMVNGKELFLVLENVDEKTIDAVINAKPVKVIALDRLFKGNDELKTNTVLQMKDANIEFKTI